MAVTYKTGGGSSKPKKKSPGQPSQKKIVAQKGGTTTTSGSTTSTTAARVVNTNVTDIKSGEYGDTKNDLKKAAKEFFGSPNGGTKDTSPAVRKAQKEQHREKVAERRENRQERRADRREKTTTTTSRSGGGGTRKTGSLRTRDDGRSVSPGGGDRTKAGFYSGKTPPRTDDFRIGGGFSDVQGFRPKAYADQFATFSGEGDRDLAISGGGGGAAGTNPLTSGTANADLDTLLKGAKRGKRQRKRRGTE